MKLCCCCSVRLPKRKFATSTSAQVFKFWAKAVRLIRTKTQFWPNLRQITAPQKSPENEFHKPPFEGKKISSSQFSFSLFLVPEKAQSK